MLVPILIPLSGVVLPGVLYILSILLVRRPMLLMLFILLLRRTVPILITLGLPTVMVSLFRVNDGVLVLGELLQPKVMTQISYN